jgi:hypothetical protein
MAGFVCALFEHFILFFACDCIKQNGRQKNESSGTSEEV